MNMTSTKIAKPLAKSLHTVTVLVRVARYMGALDHADMTLNASHYVTEAARMLGLLDAPDTYCLRVQATKQLQKGAH